MSLISRYVFREAFGMSFVVMAVLLLILMSNQFAEILGDAAADVLPKEAVLKVFGLTFLRYLSLMAPVGLLLGVLLALARLNRDSEMAALSACGVGPAALLVPIGILSLAAATLVAWLALFEAPAASREIEQIKFDAREEMELAAIAPGSFTSTDGGRTILYVRETDGDLMRGVFIQREEEGRVVVVVADEGERLQSAETGEFTLRLRNGRRYEGVPGEADFFIAEFEEHGIPIQSDDEEFINAIEAKPTLNLLNSNDPKDRAELQWRVAAPLSLLILVLLAVPLSRSSPREGRYARVGLGLLCYIIYANTLSIAYVWVEREVAPAWIGMWWVHALAASFAFALLARASGVFARSKRYVYGSGNENEPTT